jgi:hypothetical protein
MSKKRNLSSTKKKKSADQSVGFFGQLKKLAWSALLSPSAKAQTKVEDPFFGNNSLTFT